MMPDEFDISDVSGSDSDPRTWSDFEIGRAVLAHNGQDISRLDPLYVEMMGRACRPALNAAADAIKDMARLVEKLNADVPELAERFRQLASGPESAEHE